MNVAIVGGGNCVIVLALNLRRRGIAGFALADMAPGRTG